MSSQTAPLSALLTLLALSVAAAGCHRQENAGPPEVRYGQTNCDECGMTVSDDRFAAAIILARDGDVAPLVFDDIGCLLKYERTHPNLNVRARYVKDFDSRAWLPAEGAVYLCAEDIHSPMNYGILAIASHAQADRLKAGHDASISDLPRLRTLISP